jgi:low affinity Fe/Cu permease
VRHPVFEERISGSLHWVGDATSRAGVAALVAAILLVFVGALAIAGFPGNWMAGFSTAASIITLIMLFVIQHTQSRQQIALQLKLDELIRSSPRADDHLVHIELAEDAELIEREQVQIDRHESLREKDDDDLDEGTTQPPRLLTDPSDATS